MRTFTQIDTAYINYPPLNSEPPTHLPALRLLYDAPFNATPPIPHQYEQFEYVFITFLFL